MSARLIKQAYRDWAPERLQEAVAVRTKYQRQRQTEEWGYSLKPLDDHRCIFIHIPKTGGVSVAKALFGNMGPGHIPARLYPRILGREAFEAYFKFAFVRNPWDRLVSTYTFLRKGGICKADRRWANRHRELLADFERFVREGVASRRIRRELHLRPQHEWVCVNGSVAVDFVGRFERMEEDFAAVCERLGVSAALPHHNASARRDYRTYYSDATARLVGEIYRRDAELFDYAFDG